MKLTYVCKKCHNTFQVELGATIKRIYLCPDCGKEVTNEQKLRDEIIRRAKVAYSENQIVHLVLESHNNALEACATIAELQQNDLGNRLAKRFRALKEPLTT